MVEMTETATILHNATTKSLILLDEIGRGTSTYDGMSIAGAVIQHIHTHINARTLFATHYHELTRITSTYPKIRNVSMAIIDYLSQTQKHALTQLTTCTVYHLDNSMILDPQTIRNLELFQTLHNSNKTETLFWVLNKTKTSMGARKLKQWLLHPLNSQAAIEQRHAAVNALKNDLLSREEIREQLKQLYDIERLLTRIVSKTNHPRDMIALKHSLNACQDLASILQHINIPLINDIQDFFQAIQGPDHPSNTKLPNVKI
jgi:DNA mismatch repair protein MutS